MSKRWLSSRKNYRIIHLMGLRWEMRIGRSFVVLRRPRGKKPQKILIDTMAICPDIERGKWKKTDDGMITPGKVYEYIKGVLGYEDATMHLGYPGVHQDE